jgi:sugar phosphate isomerase/epimerase
MKLIVFSKSLAEKSVSELVNVAKSVGCDGYDLCIRPGHPVTPENVTTALPAAVQTLSNAGLAVPMATAAGDLTEPDHPTAEPILAALADSGVPLLKLGYFKYDPATQDFWERASEVRRAFEGWERLAEKHGVKVCYHTHSNRCMASNASMLMHLIEGYDPSRIGAFLDTGHMIAEGEEFPVAARILGRYLSIVSLKDFLLVREPLNNHGSIRRHVVEAGNGMVDWTAVFRTLQVLEFDGPLTVHCEFEPPEDGLLAGIAREVAFMRYYLG